VNYLPDAENDENARMSESEGKLTICHYELKRNLLVPTTLYGEPQFNEACTQAFGKIFRRFRDWSHNEGKLAFLMGLLKSQKGDGSSLSAFSSDSLFDFSLMGSIFEFLNPLQGDNMLPANLEMYIKHCEWVKEERIPDTVDNLVRYYGDSFSVESFVRMYRETAKQGNWETILKDLLANGFQCDLTEQPRVLESLPFLMRKAESDWHEWKRRAIDREQNQFLNSWKKLEGIEQQLKKQPLKVEETSSTASSHSSPASMADTDAAHSSSATALNDLNGSLHDPDEDKEDSSNHVNVLLGLHTTSTDDVEEEPALRSDSPIVKIESDSVLSPTGGIRQMPSDHSSSSSSSSSSKSSSAALSASSSSSSSTTPSTNSSSRKPKRKFGT